jgi:hypothetical protein
MSNCARTCVAGHRLPSYPTIYYADSTTPNAIHFADFVSGSRRRAIDGDSHLQDLDRTIAAIRRSDRGSVESL